MLYVTIVPIVVCILLYLIDPEFIYDKDEFTQEKKINIRKLLITFLVSIMIIDIFIYCYLIKKCKMNI